MISYGEYHTRANPRFSHVTQPEITTAAAAAGIINAAK